MLTGINKRSPGIKVTLCQVLREVRNELAGSLGEDLSSREHVWHVEKHLGASVSEQSVKGLSQRGSRRPHCASCVQYSK